MENEVPPPVSGEFERFLESCSEEVQSWPAWERTLLSGIGPSCAVVDCLSLESNSKQIEASGRQLADSM
jgi:hypothetical protein